MSDDNADKLTRLEEEGELAADYLEELLDIADLDGDIEIDVENGRASVEIVADDPDALDRLVGEDGEVLRTDFTVREENGILVVTLLAECREQIGRVVEFEGQVGHILPGAGT